MRSSVEWNDFVTSHFMQHPVFITYHRCQRHQVTLLHRQSGIALHLTHSGHSSFRVEDMVTVQRGRQTGSTPSLVA
jgi:hypothetical protein